MIKLFGYANDVIDAIVEFEMQNDRTSDIEEVGRNTEITEPELLRLYMRDLQRGGFILLDVTGQPQGVINMMKTQGVKRDACD